MNHEKSSADDKTGAGQPPIEEEPADAAESVRTMPGSLLLAQRETLELSLQHVADELNLTMHYVKALESDSYDKLPGDVFVKGYIRSYARLLGLDPEQMLDIYREFTTHKLARKEEAIKRYARRRMDKNRPWIIFSGVAFVVVAILLWLLSTGNESGAPVAASGLGAGGAVGGIDAMPVFDTGSAADPSAVSDAGASSSAGEILAETAVGTVEEASTVTLPWPGDDRLQINFVEDSGVEIEHRGGEEAYREVQLAGEQLTVHGSAPFSVVLDNAAGVTLIFNGRQIDFSSNIKADNSVRLNIGL